MKKAVVITLVVLAAIAAAVYAWDPVIVVSSHSNTRTYESYASYGTADLRARALGLPPDRYYQEFTVVVKQRVLTGQTWTEEIAGPVR